MPGSLDRKSPTGWQLTGRGQTGVAETFAATGLWADDLDAAGGDTTAPPSGKFTSTPASRSM